MNIRSLKSTTFILTTLIILGIFLRFYNLNWGAPYYFHPDERNIAASISQLQFPDQMNPHFFAYGSLPIYCIYFANIIYNYFTSIPANHLQINSTVSFEEAILGLRILSATLSVLLIPLLYLIGKKLKNQMTGLIASFFATISVGFIQYAHFGTDEMFLTFFSALLFYICLCFVRKPTKINMLYMSIVAGILISSKITMLVLLPIPIILILLQNYKTLKFSQLSRETRSGFARKIGNLLLIFYFLLSTLIIFAITNPYTFLDKTSFLNSMHYETNVALGSEPVFYTGEFFNTIPVVFQFLHVYPFILNPILTILFIPAFLYICFLIFFQNTNLHWKLLVAFYLLLFLSQAFFFVKWTRYMLPTLPFMYLMIAFCSDDFLDWTGKKSKQMFRHSGQLYVLAALYLFLVAYCFFITAYVQTDTRIQAERFAVKNIMSNAPIISEVYDLGITAFNSDFSNISLFNFYDLDNQSPQPQLNTTDYIILPSQRILKVRLDNPQKFPNGNIFYKSLLDGKLGFREIYETPCDIFCKIAYNGNPVFSYEETANVFDRPTIFIFKKK